ncbi:HET-domain-containing protein [Cladorrhinum samala]|uniref:HET-domain-containing protein n=1 Tax=Cladorrhinum samala TaxID=585594 RepID=A0AAV9HG92_9PEZI|nr:HET-domain-containing protein [Cladorrhinum samala]
MDSPEEDFSFDSESETSELFPEWLNRASADLAECAGLCIDCAEINLEPRFVRAYDLYEGARRGENHRELKVYRSFDDGPPYLADFYYVASLGDRLSRESTCNLCSFLKKTIPAPEHGTYKILAFCSTESYLFDAPQNDTRSSRPWGLWDHNVFMAVVPEVPGIPKTGVPLRWFETDLPKCGPIYRLTEREDLHRAAIPNLVGREADWHKLNDWFRYCKQVHRHCAPRKPHGASLPGFRVINCNKKPPVIESRPWAEAYVALSYVWGLESGGDWPQTVQDAVELTAKMGETYLWVDRLCIDQSNAQEKQFLISKMDAIYEGAEFTIIAAAGDSRTGIVGVGRTPRAAQPVVDLRKQSRMPRDFGYYDGAGDYEDYDDEALRLFGVNEREMAERNRDGEWLDLHRHGLRSRERPDLTQMLHELRLRQKYNVSEAHFRVFQRIARDQNQPIDNFMDYIEDFSQIQGIPMQEFALHLLRDVEESIGVPPGTITTAEDIPVLPVTPSGKPRAGLPKAFALEDNYITLLSTMEDARITIRNSEWATRGWTYQEGILSKRRLIFTEKQAYWECCGMAAQESLVLPLSLLHDPETGQMFDWCLSGIFDGDTHRVPELQYGFKPASTQKVYEQIVKLNGHIKAFTSRRLRYASDSVNAFLGVAARYSVPGGLALFQGLPVWSGLLSNDTPALAITFALSLSTWAHEGNPQPDRAGLTTAASPRRDAFPSWTWTGWEGTATFAGSSAYAKDEDHPREAFAWSHGLHVDVFEAIADKGQVWSGLWCADLVVHGDYAGEAAAVPLTTWAGVQHMATDQSRRWILRIMNPRVLRHEYLTTEDMEGEEKMQLHTSVPMTMADLERGHREGNLLTVLLFVGMSPRLFDGGLRFLLLRRVPESGRWERIGRLAVAVEEGAMNKLMTAGDVISGLPVYELGGYIDVI